MPKKINFNTTNNNKRAAVIADSSLLQPVNNETQNVSGGNGDQASITQPRTTPNTAEQENTPSAYGFAYPTRRRDPENGSRVEITLRVDPGTDHHLVDSNLIPGIGGIMRDVNVLESRMKIETVVPNPAYVVKSGILQLYTRDKDRNWMPLTMNVIVASGTSSHLFSTTQAAKKGVFTHFEVENRTAYFRNAG